MHGALLYIIRKDKTEYQGKRLVSTCNCNLRTAYLEMLTTKQQYRKTEGRQFYQFVQSFSMKKK